MTQKRFFLLVIIGTVAAMISMLNVDFRMLERSEEAAVAIWGFPFPMVETGPFYAGYVGIPANQGGAQYIWYSQGAFQNPHIHVIGVILNATFYTVIFLSVVFLNNQRARFQRAIRRYFKESGILNGAISLLGVFSLIILLLIATYGLLNWLSYLL
jgi:hypothetical protein